MSSETQWCNVGSNVDYSSGMAWVNPTNIQGSTNDNVYATVTSPFGGSSLHSDHLNANFPVFSTTGTITSVTIAFEVKRNSGITSNSPRLYIYNSTDGWCAGHDVSPFGTTESTRSAVCTHHSWTYSKLDSIQTRCTILNFNASAGGRLYADRAWAIANIYVAPTGYGNDVNGVASANIAEINGVATANISEVNGA